jgi:hypothetical protein
MRDPITITKSDPRRPLASGTWVRGTIGAYRFEALVFPEHALYEDYEVRDSAGELSRISKLWIARRGDRTTVYNWDRGPDHPPADEAVQELVDALCADLAVRVFGA